MEGKKNSNMEGIKLKGGSNKGVPVEQTIHYIVKDYRRMYYMNEKMVETIADLREQLRKREYDAFHRERRIEKLWGKLEAKQTEIENLKAKLYYKNGRFATPPPV